ncbi:unnamed protein product [Periconia digitata]|uniref:DUF3074 domain-containing protein n=1 Tax=Periconia digitata TaxID=1303443 RepID=A0A9W4UBE3_9PLEO|nr:unnamed protein product [Periconia digitata]
MSELHKALEQLRPKEYSDIPQDSLPTLLSTIFSKAEYIANSVPPPPNGTPCDSARRTRTDPTPATGAADLTLSEVRRPESTSKGMKDLHKAWGKPLKLGAKEAATGINVYKMAGNDRHGAWFARTSVHEGLGFAKWKRAMMREFPESLAVQGGPGEGNVRGIGGDQRLEDITVDGIGQMQVYQLSAQFPGPTAPREFITLLLTSDGCLGEASKVNGVIPRHFMVVSIPVSHPEAPTRAGMVRGSYESVEMIREIPLPSAKSPASASTSDLLKQDKRKSRDRGGTIGFAESRGPDAKGENIDRGTDSSGGDDPETNPVEWTMITRSDPGGGIPRFMVERGTPGSIVQDAGKFLDWACAHDDLADQVISQEPATAGSARPSMDAGRSYSVTNANGHLAGVGTSIADRPDPSTFRRPSQRSTVDDTQEEPGILQTAAETLSSYVPDAINPTLHHRSSFSSTASSLDSFASAEQYTTAPQGLPLDDTIPTPSTTSEHLPEDTSTAHPTTSTDANTLAALAAPTKELQKIEQKRQQLHSRLEAARSKQASETSVAASSKTAKDLEKVTEKHTRNRLKQEEKFAREVQKLEQRRERETKKLLARQQKEKEKNELIKVTRERDEWKEKADKAEKEGELLRSQIGGLQRENTMLAARLGKTDVGREVLRRVREELAEEGDVGGGGRKRAGSRSSGGSGGKKSGEGIKEAA